jgi:alkanesulfonate monooxygenase SsuD/methylene tetrahydromethanopterin reductase-like flavin-dependent oxidoreductase (luciferase family)
MDECLAALKVILHEDEPSFEGEFFKFSAVGFEPKPVQRPFPILTAGMTMGAMKRAARYGDGWYAARLSVEKMRESMEIIDRLLQDRGRDPSGFEYTVSVWDPPDRAMLKAYEDIGVHRVLVTPFTYPDIEPEPLRKIEDYARFAGMRR